jgi:hypothetical protein
MSQHASLPMDTFKIQQKSPTLGNGLAGDMSSVLSRPLSTSMQSMNCSKRMGSGHVDHLMDSPVSSIASAGDMITCSTGIVIDSQLQLLPPHASPPLHTDSLVMRQQYWSTVLLAPGSLALSSTAKARAGQRMSQCHFSVPISNNRNREKNVREAIGKVRAVHADSYPRSSTSLIDSMSTISYDYTISPVSRMKPSSATSDKPTLVQRDGAADHLKRFKCQFCASTFAQRGDMMRHIRVKGLF